MTYLVLYLRESAFQKSISSSFEENFGIISASMANKSLNKRQTGSMRTKKSHMSYKLCNINKVKAIDCRLEAHITQGISLQCRIALKMHSLTTPGIKKMWFYKRVKNRGCLRTASVVNNGPHKAHSKHN